MVGKRILNGAALIGLVVVGSLLAPFALPGQTQAPQVVISEVAWSGTAASTGDEWIELFNPGGEIVDLTGWQLRAVDGDPAIMLSGTILAGGYLLLERTDDGTIGDIDADLVYTGSLNNGGEALELRNAGAALVDSANGDGGGWPAGSSSPGYYSMERTDPTAADADGNWHSNDGIHRNGLDADGAPINGTPRQPNSPWPPSTATATATDTFTATWTPTTSPSATWTPTATPTTEFTSTSTPTASGTPTPTVTPTDMPTATSTPTPTATPSVTPTATPYPAGVSLNEFMPDPSADWNGNGTTGDGDDEYIELYNANDFAVDLSGWQVDDVDGGSSPHTLPAGTVIEPQGFLALFSAQTKIALNNSGGDSVRLFGPDGVLVEEYGYTTTRADEAYSKSGDGGGEWTRDYPPSPGASNQPAPPTVTPTATDTPTATWTPTATPTNEFTLTSTPSATATPTPTATPTATPMATPYPPGVGLNEFLPDPASDWDGDGTVDAVDEYVELYNANDFAVDLSGWLLDDMDDTGQRRFLSPEGSPIYTIPPDTTIPALGFLVLYRSQTGVALNNDGDWVRLLRPDGAMVEAYEYATSQDDEAYSKTLDGGDEWTRSYPPSPDMSNQPAPPTVTPTATWTPTATATTEFTPTSTPTPNPTGVSLNEFMPDPSADWNGNGTTGDADDEYIELYNANDFAVDLSGWKVDDVDGGSSFYVLPTGTAIEPQGFLVLFSAQTRIALNNSGGDSVRLLWPDGVLVEEYAYTTTRADEAYSKSVDGGSEWTQAYPPSPGIPNQPSPTGTLGGWVFEDANRNGTYEPWLGETGIGGVLVTLSNGLSKLTGPTGFYNWHNLPPGQYTVHQAQPVHTNSTTPNQVTVTLAIGDDRDDLNFGEVFLPADQVQSPVVLNEFLPSPSSVDWDGDGIADAADEWIELFNPGDQPVDLSGWFLDDESETAVVAASAPLGSQPYLLPPGTVIPAQGFLVVFRTTSGVALNNTGDIVRLLGPGRFAVEAFAFSATGYDVSWSKTVDGGAQWTDAYAPSPGASNYPAETTPTPAPTATLSPTSSPVPGGISVNEFMPDPSGDWNDNGVAGDNDDEYIELYNANDVAVDLRGWQVDDGVGGSSPYALPTGTVIQPRGFLVLFSVQTNLAFNNSGGDSVRLLRPDDTLAGEYTYTATSADESYSKTVDGGSEWTRTYPPSPGAPNIPGVTPTPTPATTSTATATPTATVTPTLPPVALAGISLNEFVPDPASDWDGDGAAEVQDEYVELYNANDFAVSLGGWMLDDEDDGGQQRLLSPTGSPVYIMPPDTTIPGNGFLVFYRSQTGVALNNDGDWVRLLRPDGVVAEQFEYTASRDDEAYSKTSDGGSEWTRGYPPSPGMTNTPGGTPTPTATPTTPLTPTPLATSVSLNEFMPNPASDWDGDGAASAEDEYIELYNTAEEAVDLSGWLLDDEDDGPVSQVIDPEGTRPYVIPDGTMIGPRGFLVLYRSQTGVALNNDSDSVRLLWPDGRAVESYDYSSARDDVPFSKMADGGNVWTSGYPPSPGAPNRPGYTPDDIVHLNEVLASPRAIDWDGDGQANHLDEWIELVNAGITTVHLGGWQLTDNPPPAATAPQDVTGHIFTLPAGTTLQPGQYLVIFRSQSDLALNADEEWVRLLYPDGGQADALYYDRFAGYDQSHCRLPDGVGQWTVECTETPGRRNAAGSGGGNGDGGGSGGGSAPSYDRFNYDLITIVQARALPDGPRVTLEGQVTVLPHVLDDKEIYIQDATGGMLVYLRSGEWPPLIDGQWVRVNGWLDTHDGEKEIRLTRIDDIKTLGQAPPPLPLPIRTGEVGEATEGRLVVITAPASGYRGSSSIFLDDGSGEARVIIQESTGMKRPYVVIGDMWTVVGVVSQNDEEAPHDSYYRVLPRRPSDVQRGAVDWTAEDWAALNSPPLFLPVTGEADRAPLPGAAGPRWP